MKRLFYAGLFVLGLSQTTTAATPVSYIQSRSTLQSGTTIYVSSATIGEGGLRVLGEMAGSTATFTAATPEVIFVESDQTSPAGKYRLVVAGDILYLMARNATDTANIPIASFTRFDSSFGPTFTLTSSGTARTLLRFGADSGNYVSFKASQTAESNTYVLPPSSGIAGQAWTTDGQNNTYWATPIGVSVYPATAPASFPYGLHASTVVAFNNDGYITSLDSGAAGDFTMGAGGTGPVVAYGVKAAGYSDTTAYGVYGTGQSSSGTAYGGYFVGEGPTGNGYGVYGEVITNPGYGGYFVSNVNGGPNRGVYGLAGGGDGITPGTTNYGVIGDASGTGGTVANYGGYFTAANGTNNYALYAEAGQTFLQSPVTVSGTAPQINLVESDQASPAGKYSFVVAGDVVSLVARNATDTANITMVSWTRADSSFGPIMSLASSGTVKQALRWRDSSTGGYFALVASNTIAAASQNTYTAPSSSGTAGQALLTDGKNAIYWGNVSAAGIYPATATATFPFGIATSTIEVTGVGAAVFQLTEGSQPPGVAGADVLYGDSDDDWPNFIPNNTTDYLLLGGSTTVTLGNLATWSAQGALVDGGVVPTGGGGDSFGTHNATQTVIAGYGLSVTTITASSSTFLNGTTFYYNAPIRMGGNAGSGSAASTLFINAGNTSATGASNILIGAPNAPTTGADLTTGNTITCIGALGCEEVWTDVGLTAVGYRAAKVSSGTTGISSFGGNNLLSNTLGTGNSSFGYNGHLRNVTGNNNTSFGYTACDNNTLASSTTASGQICIGAGSYADASNVLAIGGPSVSGTVSSVINDVYMNSRRKLTNAAGSSINFHAQASSGTNQVGGNFTISSGEGTGTGAGSKVIIKVSSTSVTSGTLENSIVTIASFSYTTGLTLPDNAHFNTTGSTQPALSTCGTAPSVTGTDAAFTITGGTGANGCTATFTRPFTAIPTCTVTPQTGSVVNFFSYAVSATAVTITQTGMGTGLVDVHCTGHD